MTKDKRVIAFNLARKSNVEVPDEMVPESEKPKGKFQYTTLRTLLPGQDYYQDVLYYTVPAFLHTEKMVGKGDSRKKVPVIETHTSCITSLGEVFPFDEVTLYERNFAFPKTFLRPQDDAWGGDIIDRFEKGQIKWPDIKQLYITVRGIYERYMEFSDEMYYDVMTLWVMGTYMFKVFQSYPYLHFNGTKDSGKSQNLRLLKALGFNTHWSGEMTAADMYRHVAGNPGVICIDEAESWKGERAEALRAILRSGYSRGMEVSRQRPSTEGRYEQERFPTYCPKAIASINPLDDTTRSRTIVVRMRPAMRIIPLFKPDHPAWATTRDNLHLWGLNNAAPVAKQYEKWHSLHEEVLPDLNNRSWEIAAPLITMMDYLWGQEEAVRIGEWLTTYFNEQRKLTDSTDITRLIALSLPGYLRLALATDQWYYPMKGILDHVLEYMDPDASDRVTTRTIHRFIEPLGFAKVRAAKGGRQVQILEPMLLEVFKERRIDPMPEDVEWFEGRETLQQPHMIATGVQSFGFDS